jgi:hypothetical protein
MVQPRIGLTPAKMKRLQKLLDDARTLERIANEIEHEASKLLGGGEMDWVLEYAANDPSLPFGAWCERAGVGYRRTARDLRTLRRRGPSHGDTK